MKVLWFANTPSMYDTLVHGGGWIASLERIVRSWNDCELAIAFEYHKNAPKEKRNNVTYYPIWEKRSRFRERYIDSYTYKYRDAFLLQKGLEIVNDFQPDVIQVFGSEWCFGLLAEKISIPVVIHMQGCWPVYKNTIEQVKATRNFFDYCHETYKPQLWWSYLRKQHLSKERAIREEKILSINKNFMGRTRWDKALVSLFAPHAKYFFCSEALRTQFIESAGDWNISNQEKCRLVTVSNTDMIKGFDLIFQTAKLLKEHASFEVEWQLVGNGNDSLWLAERKTGIRTTDVPIVPLGQQPAEVVMQHLLESDIFVQTSYIDNSPNAVCEAQYLGLPIIATNVGGVPSLFDENYPRDYFVPLHDPYYLAAKIIELFENKKQMQLLSEMNRKKAHTRHDDEAISASLMNCYQTIIKDSQSV